MLKLKPYFLIPFIILSLTSLIYCLYKFFLSGYLSIWLGPILVILPFMIFIIIHMSKKIARTSERLWPILSLSLLGLLYSLFHPVLDLSAIIFAILGMAGNYLYIFWYSKNERPENPLLSIGSALPEFTFKKLNGELITSSLIKSKPALILFYRGNWCPLCMGQIEEISQIAKILSASSTKIYLIGAQSLEETSKIANKYRDYPMEFLFDPYLRTMGELGLLHMNGKPIGVMGFERDTAYPTVIYTNKGGEILWTDQSDNYRVRPKPEVFLELKARVSA